MSMQIRKINADTRTTTNIVALSALGATDARAMDVGSNGTLYVADAGRDVVIKVFASGEIDGAIVGHLNTTGNVNADGITVTGNTARLNTPYGLCMDRSGRIFVGDGSGGWQIRRLSTSGTIAFLAGNYAFSGDAVNTIDGDNDGTKARFKSAAGGMGMAVDRAGVIYLADTGNHKIKKIWDSGKCTSMAGATGGGFANGNGPSASFSSPADVAVDNHGNVYVADASNHRIRKVTESGDVFTLAGTGTASFVNGTGAVATFNSPSRICIDPSNQFLYVMDFNNSAIRKVDMTGNVTTFCHFNPPATQGDICVDNSGFLYILENNS